MCDNKLQDAILTPLKENNALIEVCIAGNFQVLNNLIQICESLGKSIDDICTDKNKTLRKAFYGGNIMIIEYFMDRYIDVDFDLRYKNNKILYIATLNNNLQLVTWLFEHGITINDLRECNWCLFQVLINGNIDMLKYLITQGCTLEDIYINGRGGMFFTNKNYEMLNYLFDIGVTIEGIVDANLLFTAFSLFDADLINFLIEKGLKIKQIQSIQKASSKHNTVLKHALINKHIEFANYLLTIGFTPENLLDEDNIILKDASFKYNTPHFDSIQFIVDHVGYTKETFPFQNEWIISKLKFNDTMIKYAGKLY